MSKKGIVEETLLLIYDQDGSLTPERIVELASAKAHPLHPYFEWDNREAASRYRLLQATEMIRTVEVKIITADENYKIRAFHPMRYIGRNLPGYIHEKDVRSSERALLLQSMNREWTAMRRRYGHMNEFWKLVTADQEAKAS